MIFEHCNYLGDLELNKKETNGIRLYNLPNGEWVPSITSVTSFYNRQIFAKWRERIGVEEANRITKKATARGTDFHEAVEVYMRNKEINWDEFRPATQFMFHHAKPYLDKINNVHAIERTLYSEYLGLAGRVDCIAEFAGKVSVIDFKTSTKAKSPSKIKNYFMQEAAYAVMWEERTGQPITQLVTIISVDGMDKPQIFVEHRDNWINSLRDTIKKYNEEQDSTSILL